jgi:ABC-type uncharacterized transport system ATPase subunit
VIDWNVARERAEAFQRRMPFRVDLDAVITGLAAGEKQKLEILKQLYLGRRVLILDEPTSVLTPAEADQVLGMLRDMAADGQLSVILITHKLREVLGFARHVSVLRGGRLVGEAKVAEIDEGELTQLMFGHKTVPSAPARQHTGAQPVRVGLDFAATSEIRARLLAARNGGAAILLFSEDLDELIELADRILVMFEGRIVYETGRDMADRQGIGRHMASRQSWQRAS